MTSLLISSGEIPITLDEVRTAIGLKSRKLDGLILAAIATRCTIDEIVPTIWAEDEAATARQIAKGHDPKGIESIPNSPTQRLVTYKPTERQIYITKQKIVVWLLQQDDVLDARAEEMREMLAGTSISISAGV